MVWCCSFLLLCFSNFVVELAKFPLSFHCLQSDMDKPYEWHPKIVDIQMLKIGQFIIAAVPGEFTTMSGRRFKDNIAQSARDAGVPDPKVR